MCRYDEPSRSCDNTDVGVMGQGGGMAFPTQWVRKVRVMPFSVLNLCVIIINVLPNLGHFQTVLGS